MSRLAVLCIIAACGYPKAGPPPAALHPAAIEAARAKFPTATAESLEQGRQDFLGHCNKCHGYPALGAYSEPQWIKIVPRMGDKAGLIPSQSDQVLQFIVAARGPQSAPAPAPAK